MINTKLQSIIDTKSAIGNAIVNKGGTITSETPFFNYAAQIDGISTGTPQTIFAASDGSKWALTNVVNLTNVSNNVTYDFNYWQPANNSTSDPILNVGTVNGNISGNIRIVQVNQVNQAQYGNIVATDTTGAKYVGYNGFDANTNPTPTGNVVFNRWLLNNSASGTVLFANTTVVNGGTFNGPNTSANVTNFVFINNTANYGGAINTLKSNNGFIYVGGEVLVGTNRGVSKFREDNLALVGNTVNYGGTITSITTNNGFIYAGGDTSNGSSTNGSVRKYREDNLAVVGNTANYGGLIFAVAVNNGFIYAGGYGPSFGAGNVSKFGESNLTIVGNTSSYGGFISSIKINNGFIYVAGATNRTVHKYYESNLAFVGNTPAYTATIQAMVVNNGFIYVGGLDQKVHKFDDSTLAFVNETGNYGERILALETNNGFLYVGGYGPSFTAGNIAKYYESNLAFAVNSASYGSFIQALESNNGFIYAGGGGNAPVRKYQEQSITLDTQTFYTATKIKE